MGSKAGSGWKVNVRRLGCISITPGFVLNWSFEFRYFVTLPNSTLGNFPNFPKPPITAAASLGKLTHARHTAS